MIVWKTGTVVELVEQRTDVQTVIVRGDDGQSVRAVHYTDTFRPLRIGDKVTMNDTAGKLALGSGGDAFVCGLADADGDKRRESGLDVAGRRHDGHIMKLRYTPLQRAVLAAEEPASPWHAVFLERRALEGMPVLIGELHSMLPIAAGWIAGAQRRRPPRVAYIMSDGAALPLAYSRHAAHLRRLGWLCGTITCGHAYGGELETVNKYTALLAARHIVHADLAIAVMGPGIVGTGTPLGHTATEIAEWIHAVHALDGEPVVVPRISFADPRPRHTGLSHHLLETLGRLALVRSTIPLPGSLTGREAQLIRAQLDLSGCAKRHDVVWVPGIAVEEIARRLAPYPEPVKTMGRGLRDDPPFFAAVCAAAENALSRARPGR